MVWGLWVGSGNGSILSEISSPHRKAYAADVLPPPSCVLISRCHAVSTRERQRLEKERKKN